MIRNYIRITLRNLRRNKVTSFINLLGLSLGLATCLIAGLYIKHELTANGYIPDIKSIYRLTVQLKEYSLNGTPYLLSETIEKELPVSSTLRLSNQEAIVRIHDESFKQEIVFSDPGFFSFFSFPISAGNEKQALTGLKQVVISEATRAKYFKNENPVGQHLQIKLHDEFEDFQITAIAGIPSTYSNIAFDILIPIDNRFAKNPQARNDWGSFFMTTFLKIDADKVAAVEKAMPDLLDRYINKEKNADGTPTMRLVFNPLSQHHLNEGYAGSGITEGRSAKALYVFAGIAFIILLLACFNFMNLTNAQSSKRTVEVGIRKVVGAVKAQLMRQFLAEALILSGLSALIALGLAEIGLLTFRDMLQASISIFDREHADIYAGLLLITIGTGILAGSYPALVLSNLNALQTFKRYFKVGGSNWITRSVLSLQFALSIVLIICAIVMWRQRNYMLEADLGFNQEHLLAVPFTERDSASIDFLKTEIRKLNETVNVSRTSGVFTRGNSVSIQKMPDNSRMMIYMMSVDEDYIPTMEMEIVRGKAFDESQRRGDRSIMINEALMKKLNLQDSIGMPLGGTIGWMDKPTIKGVVKDFHHAQLRWEIAPLMFIYNEPLNDDVYLMVRVAPGKLITARDKIQQLWKATNPNSPFDFFSSMTIWPGNMNRKCAGPGSLR
jgi:putative ABC transport system permease protein